MSNIGKPSRYRQHSEERTRLCFLPLLHTLVEERVGERRLAHARSPHPFPLPTARGERRSSNDFKRMCQKVRCACGLHIRVPTLHSPPHLCCHSTSASLFLFMQNKPRIILCPAQTGVLDL